MSMRYILLAGFAVVVSGCITPPDWIRVRPPEVVIGAPTNAPPVVVPPVEPPVVVVPPVVVPEVFEYIPGDRADKGAEIWIANYENTGMGVRLSANDVQNLNPAGIPAKGSWYPLDSKVAQGVGLKLNPDGSVTASARDFVSARTGLKYHFCGFKVQFSESQLVKTGIITIPRAQCNETLRFMYATVRP